MNCGVFFKTLTLLLFIFFRTNGFCQSLKEAERQYQDGILYWQEEDEEMALESFNHCLQINPRHEKALFNRGTIFINRGDYVSALKDMDVLLSIQPSFPKANFYRGLCKYHFGDYQGALADFDFENYYYAQYYEPYFYKGIIYCRNQEYTDALHQLNKCILFNEDYAAALHEKAICYEITGKIDSATISLKQAIKLDSENPFYTYSYGRLMENSSQIEKAV
jgi:tetratricopeptide (TPR) repeat protein